MARSSGIAIENNFSKGLITETTALKFPPNACTETFDCVFDATGRVTRRLGFDLESNYVLTSATIETDEVFTEFKWTSVAGSGFISFVVTQQGSTLRFYDCSSSLDLSSNLKSFTVDLNDHLPDNATRDPSIYPCSYAAGDGRLIVVNEACDPFFIEYDTAGDSITSTSIVLKIRDFAGVDDGLTLTNRPTATVAGIKTSNPEHYYNLLNQSWYVADALDQWDTARADLPSNADYVSLYRDSVTDPFLNSRVTANDPGNTPAAKGHFILDVGNEDRNTAMTNEGFTGAVIGEDLPVISSNLGTIIANSNLNNTSRVFDDVTTAGSSSCAGPSSPASNTYVGKHFNLAPTQISKAIIFGSNDSGYVETINVSVTVTLYGKTGSAPVSGTDGSVLGTITFTDTNDESTGRTITSSDTTTVWDYVWCYFTMASTGPGDLWAIAEVVFYTNSQNTSFYRPDTVAFFAGRAWYGGIKTQGLGSNIYFSQIIENSDQYEKCYQLNDPTSESLATLLPTDGGVIKIPEMGNLVSLFPTQTSIIVLATNGVWLIAGSSNASFNATDYTISRLSTIGTNSPHSVVGINNLPFWWAEGDIYTVKFDPNYNSFQVIAVTITTIQSFIEDIPTANLSYVKGTYNINDACAYWLYNSSASPTDNYTYDSVLVFDAVLGIFYPWTIGDSGPVIRGLVTASTADRSTTPLVKYYTTIPVSASVESITFSDVQNDSYKDWTTYANEITDDGADEIDYTSYFITGYRLDGQAIKFFQSNYVHVFMDSETNASCFVQGIWDFTNSSASGKWSTIQQVYRFSPVYQDVKVRRIKIRGKGKSLQLKFSSGSGKPFTLIGWSILESANSAV